MSRISLYTTAAAVTVLAGLAVPHGPKSKPFINISKANWPIRGAAGASAVQMYMMLPPLQLTGAHAAVGFEVTLRDENVLTREPIDLSYVKYDASGTKPDTSLSGVLRSMTYNTFGFFGTGPMTAQFLLTWGFPLQLPDNYGFGVRMPANSAWPATDGLSIHAQLNLPNDPARPRIPTAHQQEVWAYEVIPPSTTAVPLGGRTLDTLAVTGSYAGSIVQGFLTSTAYGGAPEELRGPESMYPVAARGDSFSVFVHANDPAFPGYVLFLSPTLLPTPWCCQGPPNSNFYLGLASPFPIVLQAGTLNAVGQTNVGPFPIAALPPFFRSFYLQAAVVSYAGAIELTDCIGFQGE